MFPTADRSLSQEVPAPGALAETYTALFGAAAGAVLIHVRVVELLIHGWDLARATGQQASFPDDVAERALEVSRQQLAPRPSGSGAPFAAEVAVPDGAPAIDRLAGFLGRPV